jgi:uncharacterized protein
MSMMYSITLSPEAKFGQMKKYRKRRNLAVKRGLSGLGLFTIAPIERDTFIIEYKGPILARDEADERGGKYLFDINSRKTVDGKSRGNTARYINHSCRPNCEPEIVRGHIYIFSLRKIRAGEELCYDYGKEYFNDIIKPDGCKCAKCREAKS